jgi:hypothetical protein
VRAVLAYGAAEPPAASPGACFRKAPGDRTVRSPVFLAVARNFA